jgi:hypothetical protein
MALDTILNGTTSGNGQEVDSSNNAQVNPPGYTSGGVARGGTDTNAGAAAIFSEVDAGTKNGVRETLSPEVDRDYRLRVAHDNPMDSEDFTDTAQNTGKFFHAFTTLTATMSSAGLLTNSGNITTTTTGMTFGSLSFVPVTGTQTYVNETSIGFTAQPNANSVVDFGGFLRGAANPFLPQDGCFFRMTSAGLFGVVSKAGVETATAVFPLALGAGTFVYTNNANNRYLIQMNNVSTTFWINNYKYGEILAPSGGGFPCQTRSLSWGIRHSIVGGAAGAAMQCLCTGYRIFIRGPQYADRLSIVGNRTMGSYQGLSGGTMGSVATYPNSTNPTAAAPSNTALTANLPGGIGGQGLVTAAVAAATDGIWGSYQVPVPSLTVQARRHAIRGVRVDLVNMGAIVATTATVVQFSLAFGHTAVSLATAEGASFSTATTKAARRIPLGFASWAIGAAIGQMPQQGDIFLDLGDSPIYVNPGEFVALVGKFIAGTATASQTIQFVWQPLFGPE